jgi:hypothetical protein
MAIQWHPLFAYLLRPLVEGHYEVLTNVAVGDAPREADLVLLRRRSLAELPFRGLWRHLTKWNVLEYKGPTVSPRLDDIDLLIELGLGIHRRLNSEGAKKRERATGPEDVSFWYLASRLGKRFLARAAGKINGLQEIDEGIWLGSILDRKLFLVSGVGLPVERDSVPFHILAVESHEKEVAAARLIVGQPNLWELYSQFLGSMHPEVLKELNAMARTSAKGPKFHLKPLVDLMGMKEAIHQMGTDAVRAELVSDAKEKKKLVLALIDELTKAEREAVIRHLKQQPGD